MANVELWLRLLRQRSSCIVASICTPHLGIIIVASCQASGSKVTLGLAQRRFSSTTRPQVTFVIRQTLHDDSHRPALSQTAAQSPPTIMSFAAIASLRPLRSTCSRHATTSGLLSVKVQSASTTLTFRAVVSLPQTHQRRCQSQSSTPRNGTQPSRKQGQPQINFRQAAGRTLGATLRNIAVALSPRGIRSACRDAPVQTSLNIFL